MKKGIVALGVAAAATCALFAASDRIDIFDKDGKFVSIMADDIQEITVGKNPTGEGYSTINVLTPTGMRTRAIAGMGDINYVKVDYKKAHQIDTVHSAHSSICLLDCRNNTDYWGEAQIDPTKPADWHGAFADEMPHFLVFTDKGYASEFSVTGGYTGTVYTDNPNFIFWSLAENNLLGIDSYSFDMPFEPITIATTSVELETYMGAPFLGTYKGVCVSYNNSRITTFDAPVLEAEFKYNGTYVIKSTDDKAYDFLDLYDYNEANNSFAYVPAPELQYEDLTAVDTGLTGTFYDGIVIAWFHDIHEDKPDNTVPYIAAREEMAFTMAVGGTYGNHRLIEAKAADGTCRYFYINDAWVVNEVTMDYSWGNTLAGDSQAFCVLNGEKIFKYVCYGHGQEPTFTFRGVEYGTYNGSGDALSLDGYGKCTLGDSDGTYTIDGGLVTATFGSEVRIFVVDRVAGTYNEMVSDPWTGQPEYTCTNAIGAYARGAENSDNTITISFDKNFSGNDEPGTARVNINIRRTDGFSRPIGVSGSGKYIYSAETKTVVITNIYMGTSAYTSGERNLTLKLSDDMLSMWIDDSTEDRIYSTSCDGSYVLTGEKNTLTAPAPATSVELAPEYTGKPALGSNGMTMGESETTLTIDAANSIATLLIKGAGTTLLDKTVNYEFSDNTLTLKDVPNYTLVSFVPQEGITDLVFTLNEDGTLTSDMTLGCQAMGMVLDVDFSSATLTPAE